MAKDKFTSALRGKKDARKEAARMAKAKVDACKQESYMSRREMRDSGEADKAGFSSAFKSSATPSGYETGEERARRFSRIKGTKTHKDIKQVPARDKMALRATTTRPSIRTMSAKRRALAELKALREESKR